MSPRKPPEVTRSKGGWRRKPRRITPYVIAAYWPGTERLLVLRKLWPTFTDSSLIIEAINKIPAPKNVNKWQCWLMASHLRLRRPEGSGAYRIRVRDLGLENAEPMRKRLHSLAPRKQKVPRRARPTTEKRLRKVGRKPKPKQAKVRRTFSPGLSMTRPDGAGRKAVKRRKPAKSKVAKKRVKKSTKHLTSTIWVRSPKYIPKWFRERST